jgi:hypothetical protein
MANEKRPIDANVPLRKIQAEIKKIQEWRDKKAYGKDAVLYIHEIDKLDNWLGVYAECEDLIKFAPTVDAVEVVRCKDCQYFVDTLPSGYGCSGFGGMTRACPNGFCSYGERKDNERKAD